jgi:hypothetical protein
MQARIIGLLVGGGLHQRYPIPPTGVLFQLKSGRTSAPRQSSAAVRQRPAVPAALGAHGVALAPGRIIHAVAGDGVALTLCG